MTSTKQEEGKAILSEEQLTTLSSKIRNILTPSDEVEEEDVSDIIEYAIAMIQNGKTVQYCMEELTGMGLLSKEKIVDIAGMLNEFLSSQPESNKPEKAVVISEEPKPKKANALTMSGALSASRPTTRGQKQPQQQQQPPPPSNRGRGGKHKQSRATKSKTSTQDDVPATTNVVEFRYTIDKESSRKQQTSNKRTLASEAFGRLANRPSNKTEGGQPVKRARTETTTTTNRHNDDIRRHQEQQQRVSPRQQQQQQDRSRDPWHGDNFNRQPNANMKPVQVIINATQDSNYRERRGGRGGRGHHAMPPQPVEEEEEQQRYGKDSNYRGGRGGRGYTPTRPPEQQYYEAADEEPIPDSHTTYRGGHRGGRGGRGYKPPPQPVEEEEFFPMQHPPSNFRGGRGRGGRGYAPTRPPEQQYYEAVDEEPLPNSHTTYRGGRGGYTKQPVVPLPEEDFIPAVDEPHAPEPYYHGRRGRGAGRGSYIHATTSPVRRATSLTYVRPVDKSETDEPTTTTTTVAMDEPKVSTKSSRGRGGRPTAFGYTYPPAVPYEEVVKKIEQKRWVRPKEEEKTPA